MPPTEQIFWEAKSRPSSLKDSRRASTMVDESGCIITKGFVIPSRTSSQSSLAPSTTSSLETVPSTPASTLDEPLPGYSRPTGSLFHAPEFKPLRTSSSSSLHPPEAEDGHARPGLLRRETWQIGSRSISRFTESSTQAVTSGTIAPRHHSITVAQIARARHTQVSLLSQEAHMRRNKSEHTDLNKLKLQSEAPVTSFAAGMLQDRTQLAVESIVRKQEMEDAIASDSEDDDDLLEPNNQPAVGGITALRRRPDYAARRAMNDQKMAKQMEQCQLAYTEEVTTALHAQDAAQAALTRTPGGLEMTLSDQIDVAIASDSEEEDDPSTHAALELARLHRDRNSIPTITMDTHARLSTAKVDPDRPRRRSASADTLTVKIIPPLNLDHDRDEETPTEVRSYEIGSRLGAPNTVRPSRSMPRPAKGVLKKPGSRSPPRTVKTRIRSTSHEVVGGRVRARTPPNPEDERFRPSDGVIKAGSVTAAEMRMLTAQMQ